jgi:hypothetical protein
VLTKSWNSQTERYEVTFDLPAELDLDQASVVGEFNGWDEQAAPMSPQGDGRWATTLDLEPGRTFRFRYYLGGDRWENDWNADDYVPNDHGGSDSVVEVPPAPSPPPPVTAGGTSDAAKKATAKRATAKKASAKKATAKKASAGKTAAKKATAKKAEKATGEKAAAKKATAKKATAKKTSAKKATAKKAAAKKST